MLPNTTRTATTSFAQELSLALAQSSASGTERIFRPGPVKAYDQHMGLNSFQAQTIGTLSIRTTSTPWSKKSAHTLLPKPAFSSPGPGHTEYT
ncbi:MAG: hypothetical protein WC124_14820 [Desulfoplanes sp.]